MFNKRPRLIAISLVLIFFGQICIDCRLLYAEPLILPVPGARVDLSPAYIPVLLKGLRIHADNPLLFDFIVDAGQSGLQLNSPDFKKESDKLIKYFLAALTIKEDDLWVNLSPHEKDRMIPHDLGKTTLGRDMLAQDYILKQVTASLIDPQKDLGKKFWERVYTQARQLYGNVHIPVNTFNKVWIMADKAKVLERQNTAYVVRAHLKVMLDEDYLAAKMNGRTAPEKQKSWSPIMREIIIPEIEREVNTGKNFVPLRQMFYAMILSSWYKLALKDAFLNQVYSNKSKTGGVRVDDPSVNAKIYERYLKAYKKGVFNFIKDTDTPSGVSEPRKYFSGGEVFALLPRTIEHSDVLAQGDQIAADGAMAVVRASVKTLGDKNPDNAMQSVVAHQIAIVKSPDTQSKFVSSKIPDPNLFKVFLYDIGGRYAMSIQYVKLNRNTTTKVYQKLSLFDYILTVSLGDDRSLADAFFKSSELLNIVKRLLNELRKHGFQFSEMGDQQAVIKPLQNLMDQVANDLSQGPVGVRMGRGWDRAMQGSSQRERSSSVVQEIQRLLQEKEMWREIINALDDKNHPLLQQKRAEGNMQWEVYISNPNLSSGSLDVIEDILRNFFGIRFVKRKEGTIKFLIWEDAGSTNGIGIFKDRLGQILRAKYNRVVDDLRQVKKQEQIKVSNIKADTFVYIRSFIHMERMRTQGKIQAYYLLEEDYVQKAIDLLAGFPIEEARDLETFLFLGQDFSKREVWYEFLRRMNNLEQNYVFSEAVSDRDRELLGKLLEAMNNRRGVDFLSMIEEVLKDMGWKNFTAMKKLSFDELPGNAPVLVLQNGKPVFMRTQNILQWITHQEPIFFMLASPGKDTLFLAVATSNAAMTAPGGVDLSSKNMSLDIDKRGDGNKITIDPAMLEGFKSENYDGVVPRILSIIPIANPASVLDGAGSS